MSRSRTVLAISAALAFGAAVFAAAPASAAPMADPFVGGAAQSTTAPGIEQVRLVCDAWGRCWRTRPRYYAPRFYYGRPMYRRGWGYRGGWGHRRHFRRW